MLPWDAPGIPLRLFSTFLSRFFIRSSFRDFPRDFQTIQPRISTCFFPGITSEVSSRIFSKVFINVLSIFLREVFQILITVSLMGCLPVLFLQLRQEIIVNFRLGFLLWMGHFLKLLAGYLSKFHLRFLSQCLPELILTLQDARLCKKYNTTRKLRSSYTARALCSFGSLMERVLKGSYQYCAQDVSRSFSVLILGLIQNLELIDFYRSKCFSWSFSHDFFQWFSRLLFLIVISKALCLIILRIFQNYCQ